MLYRFFDIFARRFLDVVGMLLATAAGGDLISKH